MKRVFESVVKINLTDVFGKAIASCCIFAEVIGLLRLVLSYLVCYRNGLYLLASMIIIEISIIYHKILVKTSKGFCRLGSYY